jgi:hypothetical protein
MTANFTNETDQPIRLTLWIGGRLQQLRLTGTVWGAHLRPTRPPHAPATERCGRVTHGRNEYSVRWSDADGAWIHAETPPQYDENEGGE